MYQHYLIVFENDSQFYFCYVFILNIFLYWKYIRVCVILFLCSFFLVYLLVYVAKNGCIRLYTWVLMGSDTLSKFK